MFSNPILSGTALVRTAINSPDYVAAVSGWAVKRDGSAEFNDAVLRGELLVQDPNGAYVRVRVDPNAGDPLAVVALGPADAGGVTNWGEASLYAGTTGNPLYHPYLAVVSPKNDDHALDPRARIYLAGPPGVGVGAEFIQIDGDAVYAVNTDFVIEDLDVGGPMTAASTGDFVGDVTAPNLTDIESVFTATLTGGAGFALGNGVLAGVQYQRGNFNHVQMQYTFGATSNQGTGAWTWGGFTPSVAPGGGLSASQAVGTWWYVKPASTQRATGVILMSPGASTVVCQAGGGLPTLGAFTGVGQNVPEAWAATGLITLNFQYPIV